MIPVFRRISLIDLLFSLSELIRQKKNLLVGSRGHTLLILREEVVRWWREIMLTVTRVGLWCNMALVVTFTYTVEDVLLHWSRSFKGLTFLCCSHTALFFTSLIENFWRDFWALLIWLLSFPAEKLWKRLCAETATEINLLVENWKYILGGLIFQVWRVFFFQQPLPLLLVSN